MRMGPARLLMALALTASLFLGGGGCDTATDDAATDDVAALDGLEVGTVAPDFRLKNQDQGTIALSDYKGVSNVILVFYPADFTPV